jgi:hypothetical protein
MEKNKNNHEEHHFMGLDKAPFMIKAFLAVALLFIFYLVGIAVGSHLTLKEGMKGYRFNVSQDGKFESGYAMANQAFVAQVPDEAGGCPMKKAGRACSGGCQKGDETANKQLFGIITKIEANKIYILDNGNSEQAITSTAETRIIKDGIDAGINSLKNSQNVIIEIETSPDGSVVAKTVKIL